MNGVDLLHKALPLRLLGLRISQVALSAALDKRHSHFPELILSDGHQCFMLGMFQNADTCFLSGDVQIGILLTSQAVDHRDWAIPRQKALTMWQVIERCWPA